MKYLLTIISTIIGVLFFGKKFIPNIEEQNEKTKDKINELEDKIQANAQNIDVEEHAREKIKKELEDAKKANHSLSDNADFLNKH
jgi:hypothetical protein